MEKHKEKKNALRKEIPRQPLNKISTLVVILHKTRPDNYFNNSDLLVIIKGEK